MESFIVGENVSYLFVPIRLQISAGINPFIMGGRMEPAVSLGWNYQAIISPASGYNQTIR